MVTWFVKQIRFCCCLDLLYLFNLKRDVSFQLYIRAHPLKLVTTYLICMYIFVSVWSQLLWFSWHLEERTHCS